MAPMAEPMMGRRLQQTGSAIRTTEALVGGPLTEMLIGRKMMQARQRGRLCAAGGGCLCLAAWLLLISCQQGLATADCLPRALSGWVQAETETGLGPAFLAPLPELPIVGRRLHQASAGAGWRDAFFLCAGCAGPAALPAALGVRCAGAGM